MLESFIITLREGIEAALVLAIVIIYLKRSQRFDLLPAAYYGTITACAMSFVVAFILHRFALDEEALEGPIYLVAAILVTSMVIWMWRHSKHLRKDIEDKIDLVTRQNDWRGKLGVSLFTFVMVFREGVETVLFLGAISFNLNTFGSFIGGLLGLTLAVVFAVFFIRGSLLFDLSRFFKVTAVVLLLFVVQLLAGAVHEFFEFGILPAQPGVMRIVGPIVRNNLFFVLAIVIIPALLLVFPGKQKAESSRGVLLAQQSWRLLAGAALLVAIAAFSFGAINMRADTEISFISFLPVIEEEVGIPVADVADSKLHRFMTVVREDSIRFFVLQVGTTQFATHFDACEPCYGYSRYIVRGSEIVCYQCNAAYQLVDLNFAGEAAAEAALTSSMDSRGCLPVPVKSRLENGMIRIKTADLATGAKYFHFMKARDPVVASPGLTPEE